MSDGKSKLDDPTWRRERARKAGQAAQSLDSYVKRIVVNAPKLTDAQRATLAAVLRPEKGSGAA